MGYDARNNRERAVVWPLHAIDERQDRNGIEERMGKLAATFKITTLLILLVVAGAAPVLAEEKLPDLPEPLQNMVSEGAQIRYLGREHGLDGWLTIQNGQEQYFYVTADGQAILLGILFNNKGDAITLQQVNAIRQKEGPAIDRLVGFTPREEAKPSISAPSSVNSVVPDLSNPQAMVKAATKSKAEQLYQSVETANWITIGQKSAPAIYSFIDPECPHCHDLIEDFRKSGALDRGLVQLRLIPVGVLTDISLKEAAYLLASPTPEKDLFDHLDGKTNALLVNDNANTQGVQRNMQIMQDWKLDATPFSVYKDMSGNIKILQGRPEDVKRLIAELR